VQLLERCLQLFSVRKRVALPETRSKRRGDPRIFTRKVNIDDMDPPADTLQCVPLSIARAYQVVPLRIVRGKLLLATSQPERPAMLDDLERLLTMPVLAVRVPQPALNRALDRWYSEAPADYGELLQRMAHGRRKPPRTLVRDLLRKALNDGAEEVIFRAAHQCMVIYYVCDQCSRTLQTVTTPVGRGVLRELKVLFGLPTDSRHAREGSAEWVGARGPVDLQGNTSRTDFGENFRIKVLERGR
jgi:type IV pilus assembly protein PilB